MQVDLVIDIVFYVSVLNEFYGFFLSYYAQVLDWMLGKGHAVLLRRAELKTFVNFHGNEVFNLI